VGAAGAWVHDEDAEGRSRNARVGIDIAYHLGDGDRGRLIAGLRQTARVFFAAGAHSVQPGVVGGEVIRSEADIERLLPESLPAHHLITYASHPMGTCRMGAEASQSVVDPYGKVWGWDNLYVADASLFPTSLGVNPQVTTMALGHLVGDAVAGVVG